MRLFHRVAAVLALAACDESPDAWRARMAAELDRSLALYARPRDADEAEQLVRRLLGDPYRSVLVLRNRLIFDRRLFSRAKVMHHVEFVRSVMEAGPSDNFAYQFEWNANGANSEDQLVREGCPTPANMRLNRVKPKSKLRQKDATPLPRLVIAKRYGYDQCGILVPNCYFDDLTKWGRLAETITDVAAGLPFEKRDGRVFWRGSIRTEPDCDDEAGNFARTEAVALTAAHPDVFDVKCLECDVRDEARQFRPARDETATRPTSEAPISAVFQSFRLMFGRAIIPRNGLDAWMGFPEHSRRSDVASLVSRAGSARATSSPTRRSGTSGT